MDTVPAYACRVKGTDASWRKVLSRPPWWPRGWAPPPLARVGATGTAPSDHSACVDLIPAATWRAYAASRPDTAASPALQAAATIIANRQAIVADARQRPTAYGSVPYIHEAFSATEIDAALRVLASLLSTSDTDEEDQRWHWAVATPAVDAVAAYLDERVCVPRDMGAPPAAEIHRVRVRVCAERGLRSEGSQCRDSGAPPQLAGRGP